MHRNPIQKQEVASCSTEQAEGEGRIVPSKRNVDDNVIKPKKRSKASEGLDRTTMKSVQTPETPNKEETKMNVGSAARTTPMKQTRSNEKKMPQKEKTPSGFALEDSSKPEDKDEKEHAHAHAEEQDPEAYSLYTDNIAAACAATNKRAILIRMPLTFEQLQLNQQEKRLALYKKKNRMMLADNTVIMDLTKRNLEIKRELDQAKRNAARVLGGLLPRHQSNALLTEIFTEAPMDASSMGIPNNPSSNLAMRHLHNHQHQQQMMLNSLSSNNSLRLQQLPPAFSSFPAPPDLQRPFSSSASSPGDLHPNDTTTSLNIGKGKQGGPY